MVDLDKLREKIVCPQFGDEDYGEWGTLKLEQRKAIRDLIKMVKTEQEANKSLENIIVKQDKTIGALEEELIDIYIWEYAYTEEESLRTIKDLKDEANETQQTMNKTKNKSKS